MNDLAIARPDPGDGLVRLGGRLLTISFWSSIALVAAACWLMPWAVPYIPVLLVVAAAGWFLFRRPVLNLACVLLLLPLVADFEEGVELKEVLYGLYLAAFLGHWYFRGIFLEQRKVLRSTDDYLMAAILVMIVLYIPISVASGAKAGPFRSEFIALLTLAVYFPAKAAVKDNARAVFLIFLALLGIGLYVTLRNIVWMRDLVSEATVAWQITQKGRVISNEILLVVPALSVLAWSVHLQRWRNKAVILLSFLGMVMALVITQSRGFWIAFAFGCLVMLIFLDRTQRTEMILIGLVALLVSLLLVIAFFRDTALLLLAGMFNRVLSLGSAVTKDVSLINRFLESKAVWQRIEQNPILGHGLGVPYQYFNLTIAGTRRGSFIHNGYLALWYRFGVFGMLLVLTFWIRSIIHSARLAREKLARWHKVAVLTALAVLASLLVSNITSNAFFHMDSLFMFALVTGMTEGIRQDWLRRQSRGFPVSRSGLD